MYSLGEFDNDMSHLYTNCFSIDIESSVISNATKKDEVKELEWFAKSCYFNTLTDELFLS